MRSARLRLWEVCEAMVIRGCEMSGIAMLATFVGGGAGASCRYGAARALARRYHGGFPFGTFAINVSGCFALGLLASLLVALHRDTRVATALLATGFLGGYTTFSTYALEGVLLAEAKRGSLAALSLIGPVLAGLAAAALGAGLAALMLAA